MKNKKKEKKEKNRSGKKLKGFSFFFCI